MVAVAVFTSSDVNGAAAGEALVERPAGKDDLFVGVYKSALPSQVFVTARPMFGDGCADPLVFNGAPAVRSATFPPSGATQVDLSLQAPAATDDADGDGFVAPPGGASCNDRGGHGAPGRAGAMLGAGRLQLRREHRLPRPVCPANACLATPTGLSFVSSPWALTAGACSPTPVLIDTVGAGSASVPVIAPTTVTFTAVDGNLSLFSDACVTPVTSITIPAGQSRARVFISGTVAGSARLSATAPGLGTVEQAETIQGGPLNQLAFTTAAQTSVALNGCSEAVTVDSATPTATPPRPARRSPWRSPRTPSPVPSTFRFYPDAACQNTTMARDAGGLGRHLLHLLFQEHRQLARDGHHHRLRPGAHGDPAGSPGGADPHEAGLPQRAGGGGAQPLLTPR